MSALPLHMETEDPARNKKLASAFYDGSDAHNMPWEAESRARWAHDSGLLAAWERGWWDQEKHGR